MKKTTLLLKYVLALVLVFLTKSALAGPANVDTQVYDADGGGTVEAHSTGQSKTVSVSDDVIYTFYVDAAASSTSTSCVYSKSSDGGLTWAAPITADATNTTDCVNVVVWYDQWTPGDHSGQYIHILTVDTGADDLYYTRLDTATDTLSTTQLTSTQSAAIAAGNLISITQSTDGTLYAGLADNEDSFVLRCSTNCTTTTWTETTNPLDLDRDQILLMPLTNDDVMAIVWDISTDTLKYKIYDASGGTWDAGFTTISAGVTDDATYEANWFASTVNSVTGELYLAYVNGNDVETAFYTGGAWNLSTANAVNNTAEAFTAVKLGFDKNTGDVYAFYSMYDGGAVANGDVYYVVSTNDMTSWGSATQINTGDSGDLYGLNVDLASFQKLHVTWYDNSDEDWTSSGDLGPNLTPPTVQFDVVSSTGGEATANYDFVVESSGASIHDITVDYTISGTATGGGVDYTLAAGTVTIPAGSTTANISATFVNDVLDENDETVIVTLTDDTSIPIISPIAATMGVNATHTRTITDNDSTPTVTFTAASQSSVGESGTLTITAQLSAVAGRDVTVPFTLSGTATQITDYSITATPITITAGLTTADITITVVSDAGDEPNETVIVTMGSPTNATQGATTVHTATITDDDATPIVGFTTSSQTSVNETGTLTLTAQLNTTSASDVTVPFTLSGTATEISDYTITTTPITITAGLTTADITITLVDDATDEDDETVIVTMGTPTNATAGGTTVHTATINDDEGPTVTLSVSGTPITENGGVATVTATLSAASPQGVTINLAQSGTATNAVDYAASATSIVIAAGGTTGTATYTSIHDTTDETDETIIIDITTVTDGSESGVQQVTATITDDDAAPTVNFNPTFENSVSETGTLTVTAELSSISTQSVDVPFTVGGTATGSGTDYTITASPITITAGNLTASATITIVTDTIVEENETVIVTMGTPVNATAGSSLVFTGTITDDDDLSGTDIDVDTTSNAGGGNKGQPSVVSVSDLVHYAFYVDSTGTCAYRKSSDGGATWGSTVNIDAQVDCISVVVWYDRWTPGDTTGNTIHILTWDSGSSDTYYTSLDTSTDTKSTTVTVSSTPGSTQGGSFTTGANFPSITKGTDGKIYIVSNDNSDSYALRCDAACTTQSSWNNEAGAGTTVFGLDADYPLIVPLAGGDILAIQWDISADVIQSKVYDQTLGWDAAWTTITNLAEDATYDASFFGATVNTVNNDVYFAVVDGNDIATFTYSGGAWTIKENAVNNSTGTLVNAKVGFDAHSGDIYVLYSHYASVNTSTNIFVVSSDDEMTSWSAATQVNTAASEYYGATMSLATQDVFFATWQNFTASDTEGSLVVDITAPVVEFSTLSASGDEATTPVLLNVGLSYPSIQTVTVDYSVTGGDATGSGNDYTLASGTLTFAPSDVSEDISLAIVDDTTFEDAETIEVLLDTPVFAIFEDNEPFVYTINDNDTAPTVSFTAASQSSVGESGTMLVTAELSAITGYDVTVPFIVTGTATGSGTDYTISTSPITILAGSTTGTALITIADDILDDEAETVIVTMDTPTNATLGATTVHTATLTDDDDYPDVTLSLTSSPLAENGGVATVTATLDTTSPANSTINLAFSGSATQGVDYTPSATSIVITAGNLTGSITLTGIDEALDEIDESIIVDVDTTDFATEVTTQQVTATITDDDATPVVNFTAASQSSVGESGTLTITAQLDATTGQDVTVPFTLSGTATDITDYSFVSPITILSGASSGTGTITINSDVLDELDETIIVTMGVPTGATAGTTTVHTATITDDDATPVVDFTSASQTSVAESSTLTATFTLSDLSSFDVSLPFTVTGTATGSGTDYTVTASPVTVTAGTSTVDVVITIVSDVDDELDETIILTLGTPTNSTAGTTTVHTASIKDDDGPTVSLSVSGSPVTENGGTAIVTATLSGSSVQDVVVNLASSGTATDTLDYLVDPAFITIPAGSVSSTTVVTSLHDTLNEGDETVLVDIDTVTDGTESGTQQISVTITDDDTTPVVSFDHTTAVSVSETGTIDMDVNLSVASGLDVTVPYTVTGTAEGSGTDYTLAASPLVISAGNTTGTLTITLVDDTINDENETVIVTLGAPTNATLGTAIVFTGTITDNDVASTTDVFIDDTADATQAIFNNGQSSLVSISDTVRYAFYSDTGICSYRKTTDGGDTWGTSVEVTQNSETDCEGIVVWYDQWTPGDDTGTLIHILSWESSEDDLFYATLDTSNDTLVQAGEITASPGSNQAGTIDSNSHGTITKATDGKIYASMVTSSDSYVIRCTSSCTTPANWSETAATGMTSDADNDSILMPLTNGNILLLYTVQDGDGINDDLRRQTYTSSTNTWGGSSTINSSIQMSTTYHISRVGAAVHKDTGLIYIAEYDDQENLVRTYTANASTGVTATTATVAPASDPNAIKLGVDSNTGTVYMIYARATTSAHVYYRTSTDDMATWSGETQISTNTDDIYGLSIDLSSTQTLYAMWYDEDAADVIGSLVTDLTPPTAEFALSSSSGSESTTPVTVEVTLSTASEVDITVDYSVTGGTATGSGTDYTLASGTLTFAAGDTSELISITVVDEALDEDDETLEISLTDPVNAILEGAEPHTFTITDDDTEPTVSFTSSAQSTTGETGVFYLTAELTEVSGVDVEVPFTISGTADSSDYVSGASPIVIPAGSLSADLEITINPDVASEGNETLIFTMGTPVNATVGTTTVHTITIADDDDATATVTLSISGASMVEAGGVATITATLDSVSVNDVVVGLAFTGTATGPTTDYTRSASSITVLAGQLTGSMTLTGVSDALDEDDETIVVDIASVTNGAESATQQVTATILDDDALPTITMSVSGSPLFENSGVAVVTVTSSAVSGRDVVVNFAHTGTATSGVDYSPASSITIPEGDTSATATIISTHDSINEANETIILDIDTITGGTESGTQQSTITITDDDATPTVTFSNSVQDANEDAGTATVTATLSAIAGLDVTVPFTVTGTATGSGTDYTIDASPLTITAGNTTANINITIVDDRLLKMKKILLSTWVHPLMPMN